MREILFRGKRLDNGEWVEGVAFPHDNNGAVTMFYQHPLDGSLEGREIDSSTVGQFTGLTDKNGNKIFEGDILSIVTKRRAIKNCDTAFVIDKGGEKRHEVVWRDAGFYCRSNYTDDFTLTSQRSELLEIIGNIHDNSELLEGEK